MLSIYARRISSLFLRAGIIEKDDFEIYVYSFEVLLANILNFIVLGVLAFLLGRIWETIAFFLAFIPMRETAGGYHAKTHLRCFFLMLSVYIIFLTIHAFTPSEVHLFIISFNVLLSACLVLWLAPVEDANKPLSPQEKSFLRRKSRYVGLAYILTLTVLLFVFEWILIAFCISLGLLAVSLSLFATWVKHYVSKRPV